MPRKCTVRKAASALSAALSVYGARLWEALASKIVFLLNLILVA